MGEGGRVMEEEVFEDGGLRSEIQKYRSKKSEVGSQKYKYKIQGAGTQH